MESIIIIALIFFWLTITIIAGLLMEKMTEAIRKHRETGRHEAAAERNIRILKNERGQQLQKIAS